jgi:hypothetical protein
MEKGRNLQDYRAIRGKMLILKLAAVRCHGTLSISRQVKNLLTQITTIILVLQCLQEMMQLEGNLSGPHAGLGMLNQQMVKQDSRCIVTPTGEASCPKAFQYISILPELGKITGGQGLDHLCLQNLMLQACQSRLKV